MPHNSDVNWVTDMKIEQEYTKLDNGEWVLSKDDMIAELHVNKLLQDLLVVRNTRITNYAFDALPKQLFKGKAKIRHDMDAMNRDEAYWNKYRQVDLTKSESSMDSFIHRMENSKGFKYIIFGVRALMENYVEVAHTKGKKVTVKDSLGVERDSIINDRRSLFDLGPINTFLSNNYVDGVRLRLAGRTMAALNPHFFWDGYGAYGLKSNKWYYGHVLTYSFNKKKNSPFEFPMRKLTFELGHDITPPSDDNLLHNKDNFFMTLRWQSNRTVGNLHYYRVSDGEEIRKIRTTEASVGLNYNPGVTYVNTKQQRLPINLDSPEISLRHTMGLDGFMGGQYQSNLTTLGIYKRLSPCSSSHRSTSPSSSRRQPSA